MAINTQSILSTLETKIASMDSNTPLDDMIVNIKSYQEVGGVVSIQYDSSGAMPILDSAQAGLVLYSASDTALYGFNGNTWATVGNAAAAGGDAVSWTVDLSNVTYDNVSFNITSQQANPTALTLSADGTKMYVGGNTNLNEKIDQYSLSTAFDLSTASYDSVSFASLDIQELYFSTDGTKLFYINLTTVFQNSLTTPFDLSTASYDSVFLNVSSQENVCRALAFNDDGTKMYVAGSGNDTVYQYSLSTAFDLSTASYDSIGFSVSSVGIPYGIRFNTDGTKMYIQGSTSDQIYQYSLSTGFDVSTASSDGVTFAVTQGPAPESLTFSADGTKMYIIDNSSDAVYQYSTGL